MIYGVIPARKNSKTIFNKNFFPLCGLPLIYYTIESAIKSELKEIIITTDYDLKDFEPFIKNEKIKIVNRPDHYCDDTSPATMAIYHLLHETSIPINKDDSICLLQPTTPLRDYKDINNALLKYMISDKKSLVSCVKGSSFKKIYSSGGEKYNNNLSSYDKNLDKVFYIRNSAIYIFVVEQYLNTSSIFDDRPELYIMPTYKSIDIDTIEDMEHAQYIIRGLNK